MADLKKQLAEAGTGWVLLMLQPSTGIVAISFAKTAALSDLARLA